MFRLIASVAVLLALVGTTGALAYAQDTATTYVVTSRQNVNARACPQLNCAVVRKFAPGEELAVTGTAQGDSVTGSPLWLVVSADGQELYVHSSLAAPAQAGSEGAVEHKESVSSSGRETYSGANFSLDAPTNWTDLTVIFEDDEALLDLARLWNMDQEDLRAQMRENCGDEGCDLFLIGPGDELELYLTHTPLAGLPRSAALLKVFFSEYFEEIGEEIVSADIVELPIGQTVRIETGPPALTPGYPVSIYFITVVGDQIYLLTVWLDPNCAESYREEVDAIAASLQVNSGGSNGSIAPADQERSTESRHPAVRIGAVVMATTVDDAGCPGQVATIVNDDRHFYIVAKSSDIPQGTRVFVRLIREGVAVEDAPEIVARSDYVDTCVNFVFEPSPGELFASGSYEAQIIVNGAPVKTVSFYVTRGPLM